MEEVVVAFLGQDLKFNGSGNVGIVVKNKYERGGRTFSEQYQNV